MGKIKKISGSILLEARSIYFKKQRIGPQINGLTFGSRKYCRNIKVNNHEFIFRRYPYKDMPAPRLHPNLAAVYRQRVEGHQAALQGTDSADALEVVRGLIERVVLHPEADGQRG